MTDCQLLIVTIHSPALELEGGPEISVPSETTFKAVSPYVFAPPATSC